MSETLGLYEDREAGWVIAPPKPALVQPPHGTQQPARSRRRALRGGHAGHWLRAGARV
ncbi:MAG TPA: hypothetical protein VFW09_15120 [Solirubrobacteraceae bacterium]|nr:hypothetical protein [Solirubrobacteraceae bacterium]